MPFSIVDVEIDYKVRGACKLPYPEHPQGCPNFGHRDICPPNAPKIETQLDLSQPVYAVWNAFDLRGYIEQRKTTHPGKTERWYRNPMYW